jgi:hypothetical protein
MGGTQSAPQAPMQVEAVIEETTSPCALPDDPIRKAPHIERGSIDPGMRQKGKPNPNLHPHRCNDRLEDCIQASALGFVPFGPASRLSRPICRRRSGLASVVQGILVALGAIYCSDSFTFKSERPHRAQDLYGIWISCIWYFVLRNVYIVASYIRFADACPTLLPVTASAHWLPSDCFDWWSCQALFEGNPLETMRKPAQLFWQCMKAKPG